MTISTNFSSFPFLSLGKEEWLHRFDGDEVVPGFFHICGIKINHPHPAYRAPGRMTPLPKEYLRCLKRRGIVRAGIFFPVLNNFTAKVVISTDFSSWPASLKAREEWLPPVGG
jgi:hypothetical protein